MNARPRGMRQTYQARFPAPFAVLGIRTTSELLTDIEYLSPRVAPLAPLNRLAERTCRQIERYLDDPEYRFDLPFEFNGSEFQCRVWREIWRIPIGGTTTYRDIARRLGTAPRPVGQACGSNRIPVVIPCHRVVSSHGIGGFMKSRRDFPLEIKRWLLRHEGAGPVDER